VIKHQGGAAPPYVLLHAEQKCLLSP